MSRPFDPFPPTPGLREVARQVIKAHERAEQNRSGQAERGVPVERRGMAWYAVRCCCQPQTIFGFLPLPIGHASHRVLDRYGAIHTVELKAMRQSTIRHRLDEDDTLTVDDEVAVYSDDRPLEFWRTIPGFIEAAAPPPYPLDARDDAELKTSTDAAIARARREFGS